MSKTLEKSSPCKVNLLLNILGKRTDGFHELETVMQPVAIEDQLAFTKISKGIELTCDHPTLPAGEGNLVYRAAAMFLTRARTPEGVRIHLQKKIPLAAGLGGGSGNAAITLLALNELFERPLTTDELAKLAASLGSDIPFFLQSQPALALGRGEQILPLEPFRALQGGALLLIHPGFGISTAWTYQALARFPAALHGQPGRAERLIQLLRGSNLQAACAEFYNALEMPALEKYPLLGVYQKFLQEHGAAGTLMSGSGSTTFAVMRTLAEARNLEEKVQTKFGPCWTAVTGIVS